MQKKVLLGNEAIARGAYEAGCRVATAYPGTPSTEILESMARDYKEIKSQWVSQRKSGPRSGGWFRHCRSQVPCRDEARGP